MRFAFYSKTEWLPRRQSAPLLSAKCYGFDPQPSHITPGIEITIKDKRRGYLSTNGDSVSSRTRKSVLFD